MALEVGGSSPLGHPKLVGGGAKGFRTSCPDQEPTTPRPSIGPVQAIFAGENSAQRELVAPVKWSPGLGVAVLSLRAYLVVSAVLLLVKAVQLDGG